MTAKPPPRWELLRVEPSGAIGRVWALPLVGLASAAVSAFVYAWVNVYCPIAGYVSVLFVAMLAAGAALPVAFAARWAKCRNLPAVRCVGAATGLAAIYFAWAFFAWVLLWHSGVDAGALPSMLDFVRRPEAVWAFAVAVDKEGWYSFGHGPGLRPSGVVLWLFWLVEAVAVVAGGWLLAPSRIAARAFCENCDDWLADERPLTIPADAGAVGRTLVREGFAALTEVAPATTRAARWVVVNRQRCRQCQRAAFAVAETAATQTRQGKVKTLVTPLLPLTWTDQAIEGELARIARQLAGDAGTAAAAPG
jgi:hypothetical protein